MIAPYEIAHNLLGLHEEPGNKDNYFVDWCLSLCHIPEPIHDEIAWCSALGVGCCKLAGIEGSKSAAARSWIGIGTEIDISMAMPGYVFVVLSRGGGVQPGPEVKDAPGHFTWFSERDGNSRFFGLGGNQADKISIESFSNDRILYVGRLG
jgi:uncharacterized protein (TIGR02594 family)